MYIEIEPKMTELLKQVAKDHLYKTQINNSKRSQVILHKTCEEFDRLEESLNQQQEQLLTNLDEALNLYLEAATADHYIKGFMHGYLFLLKNQEKT